MADHDGIQSVTRRQVLKGGAAIAALGGVSAFLAACSSSAATAAPASAPAASAPAASAPAASAPAASAAAGGSLHIGSNHSDPGEKAGMDAINAAFKTATGIDVVMNTVDHGTFQDQITNYLGGTPDTAYTWFSGFRMKFFADQGLNIAIDDVWATVKEQLHRRLRELGRRQRRQGLRHPGRLLPVGGLLPEERLRGQGLHDPHDLGRAQDARDQDAGATASPRSPSATRTAGPPWARSTS